MREHSEYYFEIGKELSGLVDDQELVDQLGLAFNRRVQDLINTALNAGSKTDLSSVMQKLTLPEKVDLNPSLNPYPYPYPTPNATSPCRRRWTLTLILTLTPTLTLTLTQGGVRGRVGVGARGRVRGRGSLRSSATYP